MRKTSIQMKWFEIIEGREPGSLAAGAQMGESGSALEASPVSAERRAGLDGREAKG